LQPVQAQSISFQRNFVADYSYQNVTEPIDFDKFHLRYTFNSPAYVSVNSESAEYSDAFENYIDYMYVGIALGTYINIYKGLVIDVGYRIEKAFRRDFDPNERLVPPLNRGSKSDIEDIRHSIVSNISYNIDIYKQLGITFGLGIETILNPYSNEGYYGYNNQTNIVKFNFEDYEAGISTFYIVNFGVVYRLKGSD
jgi:hypothetical protein